MVNEAVRLTLAEDLEDLKEFETRKGEPSVGFEDFLESLKKRGKL